MYFNVHAIGAAIFPNTGGIINSFAMRESLKTWYPSLKKPSWTPPNWVFGPAWTTLYSSIGYASYLIYREGGGFKGPAGAALSIYGANLALNWAWTPIFFNARNLKMSFYEILLVDTTAVATGIMFHQINNFAGYLIIPYLMWLSFATALNYRIYKLN